MTSYTLVLLIYILLTSVKTSGW